MGNLAFWQSKNRLLSLQILFRPLLLISLALHGLVLSLPLPSAPEVQSKSKPQREETVKITRLLPSSSKPATKAGSTIPQSNAKSRPTQPKTAQSAQKRSPNPLVTQKPLQNPTSRQSSQKVEAQTEKALAPKKPSAQTEEPKVSESEIAAAGSSLLEELRPRILRRLEQSTNDPNAMKAYLDSLPIQFVKDEQRPFFFNEQEQLKQGALGFLAIPQTNPTGAYYEYIEPVIKNELGFKIVQLTQSYGQSNLYKAENQEGVVFYMSLVKLKGSGALLVLWQDKPSS